MDRLFGGFGCICHMLNFSVSVLDAAFDVLDFIVGSLQSTFDSPQASLNAL
jgi:hypothetical protein